MVIAFLIRLFICILQVLAEAVKKKFRPLEDLRKDFDKLNLNVKTELEILTELMAEYKDPNLSEQRHLHILMELEYYVHQVKTPQIKTCSSMPD